MRRKLTILFILAAGFITVGLGCRTSGEARKFQPVTLQYWGVFEDAGDIALLTGPYSRRHPKVNIQYRKFREDEYKQKMLEAWALGQGPDMFMIPSTRIREFLRFIEPMPAKMSAPVEYQTGTLKKETITEIKTYAGYSPRDVRDKFIDTVAQDVVVDGKVYALPYSIDTLSVYYNRTMLRNNNVPLPASTWTELIEQAGQISKLDTEDNLAQSTIALGTTNNISGAIDIISTIMMQLGVALGDSTKPLFGTDKKSLDAIQFYLSFAQKGLQNYSWNEDLPDALDAFTAGRLAYFIGYPYHAELIKDANPSLDWDVIPMFRPENADATPTYANYWVTVVSKPSSSNQKQKAELAWQYLLESTDKDNVKPFLSNKSNPRTTALKSLVASQQKDLVLGPFAQRLLNAKSWYYGYNAELMERYFLEMIDTIRTAYLEGLEPEQFLSAGAARIGQTYQAPR